MKAVLAMLVIALLAISGCGDDEDSDNGGNGAADTPAATTETEPATTTGPETTPGGGEALGVDACELLEEDEVAERIGDGFRPESKTDPTIDGFPLSQCVWEVDEGSGAGPRVGVAVIGSPERYEMTERSGRGEPVEGLGDEAVVTEGISLEDRGGTGGRTVFVLDGERTLVVALRLERGVDVSTREVVDLAGTVHGRLP